MNVWFLITVAVAAVAAGPILARGRSPRAVALAIIVPMTVTFVAGLVVIGGALASAASDGEALPTDAPAMAAADETPAEDAESAPVDTGAAFIGAAIAVAASALGAGIAIAYAGPAALATVSEQPDLFGRAMVVVGLAEGVAIYGLIIAVLILGNV